MTYEKALDQLLDRNKSAIKELIHSTIPDEPIYFEDYIDDDGHGVGPWKIAWYFIWFLIPLALIILVKHNDKGAR